MNIKININMDNAAFDDYPEDEVIRILKTVISSIELNSFDNKELKLFDINGNSVGKLIIKGD